MNINIKIASLEGPFSTQHCGC